MPPATAPAPGAPNIAHIIRPSTPYSDSPDLAEAKRESKLMVVKNESHFAVMPSAPP